MSLPGPSLASLLLRFQGAPARGLRALYRRLPLGASERRRVKAVLQGCLRPFARLSGPRTPPWSALIPAWSADWSSLLPACQAACEPAARRMLVIDWKPPTPDRDSGSFRMGMLLELMREAGWEVDFIGDRAAEGPAYSSALHAQGIAVIIGQEAAWRHLSGHGGAYRVVWISRPEIAERYLPLVHALAVQARVIYDTVDLHWIRLRRGMPFSETPETLRLAAERYRGIELCNARCSDLTIAITQDEQQALLEVAPDLAVAVLPNIHPLAPQVAAVSTRSDLFFIGSFSHPPNADAVLYFAREIFPLIRAALPEVRVYLAGSEMPYEVRALKSKHIRPLGYVREVTPWFERCRVFIAPLRHGAGMKGKVGQSLALGLPVVTTSVGAEGMGLTHGLDAMIVDDPQGFAQAVLRVYTDDRLWGRLSQAGQAIIRQRFSKEAVGRLLTPLLDVEGAPSEHTTAHARHNV